MLKQEDLDEPHKDGGERNEPHHHAPELEDQTGGFLCVLCEMTILFDYSDLIYFSCLLNKLII